MNKIDIIDNLLNNSDSFSKYINGIENMNIYIPENLNDRINSKIEKHKKKYYIDICKIAACLIFGLFLCRTDFIRNDDFKFFQHESKREKSQTQEQISKFCYFLTTPINIERNDKK